MTATKERPRSRPESRRKPQRSCIACRTTRAKHELVRVVRDVDGTVAVDAAGKHSGRGAYLCPDLACWERGLRGSALERHLSLQAPLSEKERGLLREQAQAIMMNRQEGH